MSHLHALARRPYELAALAVLLAVGLGDAISTWLDLSRGGSELNPVVAAYMGAVGVIPALALRVVVPALAAWALLGFLRRFKLQTFALTGLFALAAIWAFGVGHNVLT